MTLSDIEQDSEFLRSLIFELNLDFARAKNNDRLFRGKVQPGNLCVNSLQLPAFMFWTLNLYFIFK